MKNPHLKLTRPKPAEDYASVQFACLVEPATDIRSDSELYAAVLAHGKAVIVPFNGVGWMPMPAVTLEPEEFQQTWKGD